MLRKNERTKRKDYGYTDKVRTSENLESKSLRSFLIYSKVPIDSGETLMYGVSLCCN